MNHPTESWFERGFRRLCYAAILLAPVILPVVLIALPLTRAIIAASAAGVFLGGRLESFAVGLEIPPALRWLFTLVILTPVTHGVFVLVRGRRGFGAGGGLALVMAVLLGLLLVGWCTTRDHLYDRQGRPIVFLSFRADGIYKSYSGGHDPVTGKLKEPVTRERAAWLSKRCRHPVEELDPAVAVHWFDPATGDAQLWYFETGTNQFQFFNRPHFHRQLGIEVLPVTRELMARWARMQEEIRALEESARRQAEADRLRRAEEERVLRERERAEAARQREQADLARRQRDAEMARSVQARRQAEAQARAKAERERQEQRLEARRVQEAMAPWSQLETWHPVTFVQRVFPSPQAVLDDAAFEHDYRGRRFRFTGRPSAISRTDRTVCFESRQLGQRILVLRAEVPESIARPVRVGRDLEFAAPVMRVTSEPSPRGIVTVVHLGGMDLPGRCERDRDRAGSDGGDRPGSWVSRNVLVPAGKLVNLPFEIGTGVVFGEARPLIPMGGESASTNLVAALPPVIAFRFERQ